MFVSERSSSEHATWKCSRLVMICAICDRFEVFWARLAMFSLMNVARMVSRDYIREDKCRQSQNKACRESHLAQQIVDVTVVLRYPLQELIKVLYEIANLAFKGIRSRSGHKQNTVCSHPGSRGRSFVTMATKEEG